MTKIFVKQIIWEDKIIEHIKKHKVSCGEVEGVSRHFLFHKKGHSGKYLLVGRSGSRMLTVVVLRKGVGVYFVITARDSGKKERREAYEKENNR